MEKIISGKVREVYDVGQDRLVIVATDRTRHSMSFWNLS